MSLRTRAVSLRTHVSSLRRRIEEAGIERTFFLCSTPRTGSTMLGNTLAETGLVGRAGEYFGEPFRREIVPGLSRRRFDDYLVGCLEHARGTGTFGVKLHWDQVGVFLHLLRLRRGLAGASDGAVVEAVFPRPSYVFLTREDTLAQAVSWWRAMTSGTWTDGRPAVGEPAFDFDGIAGRLRRIEEHNEAWEAWFRRNALEPLRLSYERAVADPLGAVVEVLRRCGVEPPAGLAVSPATARQGDGVNDEWIRRYRELAAARPS